MKKVRQSCVMWALRLQRGPLYWIEPMAYETRHAAFNALDEKWKRHGGREARVTRDTRLRKMKAWGWKPIKVRLVKQ